MPSSMAIKLVTLGLAVLVSGASVVSAKGDGRSAEGREGLAAGATLRFTVLYDNYLYKEGTKPDWGFACLIEGAEKTILFDTGTRPEILMHNVGALGVDLKKVDMIVITHNHGDHTGGLPAALEKKPGIPVFFPASFPAEFGRRVEELGGEAQAVGKPLEICRNVHLTGELGEAIVEQSLVIDTPGGLVVVTGCSHPGIVKILRRAMEIVDKPIALVFGGFHLRGMADPDVEAIVAAFKEMKVERCGATHCTGDRPIALFKAAFGDNFVPIGTGRVIEVPGY
jgi:7,8-dihydropterin-6-yl-methyl-4-(beta-D-ribofuranosyl)aminobenzene 5'-phosphate synthase